MAFPHDTGSLIEDLRRDGGALDRLIPRIYEELHRMAHSELARRQFGVSLCTTGLLHETYVRLADRGRLNVDDRAHFMALVAKAMRHIVIDYARARQTKKRGGNQKPLPLDGVVLPSPVSADIVIAIHEALERLERFDERLCRVVEHRFFGGLSIPETAAALDVSPRTVDRAWQRARAWLIREMHEA